MVIRFPDLIVLHGPAGRDGFVPTSVRATTRAGSDTLSDTLGFPARRATEVDAVVFDAVLADHPHLTVYDVAKAA